MSGDRASIARAYSAFADAALERSELYVELARGVAGDDELLAFLAELPQPKRQPNLLFAAVKHLCGTPDDWREFRAWVFARREEIAALMRTRRTQTNEPARCATLLPLLATLSQPLALLEVGASAGLCLLIDRYGYDYGGHRVPPVVAVGPAPVFACRANALTPLPARGVEVAWRAGIDLDPVDVRDADQVAWLEALVWPGEGDRLEQLHAAVEVARADPPRVLRGDLRRDLPALAAQAPPDATLVVFHTAVLAYVSEPAERVRFGDTVRALGATWIANESPQVFDPDSDPGRGRGGCCCGATDSPWPGPTRTAQRSSGSARRATRGSTFPPYGGSRGRGSRGRIPIKASRRFPPPVGSPEQHEVGGPLLSPASPRCTHRRSHRP
jgi:hypothetical protein